MTVESSDTGVTPPAAAAAVCPGAAASGDTSRRAVIGMAVGVGALCAGCATYGTSAGAPETTEQTNPPAAGSGTPPAGAAAPAPLAQTSAVPVGGATILTDRRIVLAQPTAGTYKAFTAVCTHQGCTVSSIADGLIICPCHGSRFHLADGSVESGPASRPLAPIAIKVTDGKISLA